MRMKKLRALFLAMTVGIALMGCQSGASGEGGSSGESEVNERLTAENGNLTEQDSDEGSVSERQKDPVYGGTLYMSREGTMTETDLYPHMKQNSLTNISMSPAVEQLFYLDGQGEMVPQLAKSWEVSDDGLTYTFHLQEGVKFHDGSDFNAEVAMWNLQQGKDVAQETNSSNDKIDTMKVVDEHTLEVTFSEVTALTFLSFDSWIFSQKAFEENGLEWCSKNPVGTGPFVFDHWTLDSELVYTKNENYWVEGQPYLDGVTFKIIKDNVALAAAMQNDEVDGVNNIKSTELIDTMVGQGDVNILRGENVVGVMSLMPCGTESSPLNNTNIRKALAYAMDWKAISESTFHPEVNITLNQIASPDSMFYSDQVTEYTYDPEKAIELLNKEGYNESNPLSVVLVSENNPVYKSMCEAVQAYFLQVGIDCDINILESAAYFEQVIVNPWEDNWIVYMASNFTGGVPLTVADRLMGANHAQTFASVYFPDEWVDNIVKAASQKTLDEAVPYYKAANEAFFNDYCGFIGVNGSYSVTCMKNDIHGYIADYQTTQYGSVWKENN